MKAEMIKRAWAEKAALVEPSFKVYESQMEAIKNLSQREWVPRMREANQRHNRVVDEAERLFAARLKEIRALCTTSEEWQEFLKIKDQARNAFSAAKWRTEERSQRALRVSNKLRDKELKKVTLRLDEELARVNLRLAKARDAVRAATEKADRRAAARELQIRLEKQSALDRAKARLDRALAKLDG